MSHNPLEELEEGEILEEIPSVSQKVMVEKPLPRRYVLHENKSLHYKHKKSCRRAAHYHAQKLAKFKKTLVKLKDPHKKHHKSCCRHAIGKTRHAVSKDMKRLSPVKENSVSSDLNTKNEVHFSSYSLYVEMTNNFKNRMKSSHKIPLPKKSDSEKFHVNSVTTVTSTSVSSDSLEVLSHSNKEQNDTKHLTKIKGGTKNSSSTEVLNFDKVLANGRIMKNDPIERDTDENFSDSVGKETCEESEDEEELRRIALATCAKRTFINVSIANESSNAKPLSSDSLSLPLAVQDKAVTSQSTVGDYQAVDNYEVVDMEVDDEEEIVNDDQLFTIDKNPTPVFEGFDNSVSGVNSGDHSTKIPNVPSSQIDNDFEAMLIRAELISDMINQKKVTILKNQVMQQVPMETSAKVKCVGPPKNNFYKSVRSVKKSPVFVRKPVNNVPKPECNVSTGKSPVIKPHERVIINVGETSTDESDQDDLNQEERDKENAVASIEALISDARQKSDESKANIKMNNVPDAVSCLSKAQQEEYNSLKKLLAQKSAIPRELKKPVTHSPSEDLKVLEKKFAIAEENLQKDKLALINTEKEFSEQKNVYIKSRLTVQYLKEQLVAADRVRKSHFKSIKTLSSKLVIMKTNVSKREAVVIELKNECTKLGFSIRGENYTLPPTTSNLSPQINPTS